MTVKQKEAEISRVSSAGSLSISEAPGDPAESRGERRRSVRPAHVGSKAQQPGGCICSAWTTPQLPSFPSIYRNEREMK